MDIITAIREHAASQADSRDWLKVAEILSGVTETAAARLCHGVETADALDAVGPRRRAIMAAMQADPDGRFILTKLAGAGVIWAHPRTLVLMDGLIAAGKMHADDKATLVALSAPVTRPFSDVTAMQCEAVWIATEIVNRRSRFDQSVIEVRSRIESGELTSDVAIADAVTVALKEA